MAERAVTDTDLRARIIAIVAEIPRSERFPSVVADAIIAEMAPPMLFVGEITDGMLAEIRCEPGGFIMFNDGDESVGANCTAQALADALTPAAARVMRDGVWPGLYSDCQRIAEQIKPLVRHVYSFVQPIPPVDLTTLGVGVVARLKAGRSARG